MNATFPAIVHDLWSLAGWTMVHFLWLGTIVAAFTFAGRMILRNAAPNARYSFSLVCLALIIAMPLVAAWFHEPSPAGRGQGEGALSTNLNSSRPFSPENEIQSPASPLIELHTPSSEGATTAANPNSPPLKGGARGGIPINASPPPTLNHQPSTLSLLAPRSSPLSSPTSPGSGSSARHLRSRCSSPVSSALIASAALVLRLPLAPSLTPSPASPRRSASPAASPAASRSPCASAWPRRSSSASFGR